MNNLYSPRDWLESVPDLEAPTDAEIQSELDIMCRTDRSTLRSAAAGDDWAEHCED